MTPLPRGYLRPSMTIRLSLGRCVWTTALSPTSRSVVRSSRPQRYWGRARFSKAVIGTTCTSYSTCRAVLISCTLVITCEPCQPRRYALAAVAATSIAIGSYQTPSFRARYSDILRSKRTLGWRCADVSLCILKGVGRIWTEAHCMRAYLRGRTCAGVLASVVVTKPMAPCGRTMLVIPELADELHQAQLAEEMQLRIHDLQATRADLDARLQSACMRKLTLLQVPPHLLHICQNHAANCCVLAHFTRRAAGTGIICLGRP